MKQSVTIFIYSFFMTFFLLVSVNAQLNTGDFKEIEEYTDAELKAVVDARKAQAKQEIPFAYPLTDVAKAKSILNSGDHAKTAYRNAFNNKISSYVNSLQGFYERQFEVFRDLVFEFADSIAENNSQLNELFDKLDDDDQAHIADNILSRISDEAEMRNFFDEFFEEEKSIKSLVRTYLDTVYQDLRDYINPPNPDNIE